MGAAKQNPSNRFNSKLCCLAWREVHSELHGEHGWKKGEDKDTTVYKVYKPT